MSPTLPRPTRISMTESRKGSPLTIPRPRHRPTYAAGTAGRAGPGVEIGGVGGAVVGGGPGSGLLVTVVVVPTPELVVVSATELVVSPPDVGGGLRSRSWIDCTLKKPKTAITVVMVVSQSTTLASRLDSPPMRISLYQAPAVASGAADGSHPAHRSERDEKVTRSVELDLVLFRAEGDQADRAGAARLAVQRRGEVGVS